MPDLSDAFRMIRELQAEVRRLRTPIQLENSSITDGRMRFIGGLLRVDSGGRVEIEGTLEGGGTFIWTGTLTNNGPLIQNGTWKLNGTGEIVGNTLLTGNLSVSGGGKITAGNVTVEPNMITVGTGSASAVLQNGELKLANGAKLAVGLTGGDSSIGLVPGGSADISANLGTAWLRALGSSVAVSLATVTISAANVRMDELPTASSTTGLSWIAADSTGKLFKVPQGIGGPIGGPLQWPFPSSSVTSEFGPRPSPGPGGSTDHEGLDFAPGEGTAIPSAGSGTVELAGDNGGFGYCVIINHGGGLKTLYAHMQAMPSVTVGQTVAAGQIIGLVGNTGISFGAHLHFEVHVNGTPVNPRTKLPN